MSKTIEAVYDGKSFQIAESLDILPDTKVWITVEQNKPKSKRASFLDVARSANIEGPADWSENLDSYLYDQKVT